MFRRRRLPRHRDVVSIRGLYDRTGPARPSTGPARARADAASDHGTVRFHL
jgi:hypothetical protein